MKPRLKPKHALKAFTDALRMELEEGNVPISLTLVKSASINTLEARWVPRMR